MDPYSLAHETSRAPQSKFCGASVTVRHRNVTILWRTASMVRHRMSLFCGALIVVRHRKCAGPTPTHGSATFGPILWRTCQMRHRICKFCGAPLPMRHRISIFCGASERVRHRITCAGPTNNWGRDVLWRTSCGAPQNSDILWRTRKGCATECVFQIF